MTKSQIKKIGISLLTVVVLSSSIFAVPKDPNSFYGSIQVESKNITDTTLNAYLNGNLQDSIQVKSSYYGEVLNLITLTGKNGDLVEFELVSNECQETSNKINTSYQEGKSINLNLDFTGTNTCNNIIMPSQPDDNSGGSSGGGGSSSGGGSSGGSSSGSNSNSITEIETQKNTSSTNNTSQVNEDSSRTKAFLDDNKNSETISKIDNISIVNSKSNSQLDKTLTSESKSDSEKQTVSGLSGNIVKNTSKSLIGIIILILTIAGFILWRENKKRNLRLKKELKNKDSTNNVEINDVENNDSDSENLESKKE